MKVKVLTLSFQGKVIEFAVWAEQKFGGEKYVLLLPKVLYIEMNKAVVDDMVLFKALHVYRVIKSVLNEKADEMVIREEDLKLKEKLYELVHSNTGGTGISIRR